jgi:hypothetical protein
MNTKQTPHDYRRQFVHSLFIKIILAAALIIAYSSCRTEKTGCESLYKNKRKFTAWIKCNETKRVTMVMNDGSTLCTFIDKN